MEDSISVAEASGAEDSIGEDVGEDSVGVGGKYSRSVLRIFGFGESSIAEDILYLEKCSLLQHLAVCRRGSVGPYVR